MTLFNRTTQGLIAKYHFYQVPVIWVEGPTDVQFYRKMLRSFHCRIESAGGRGECRSLADALIEKDYPYVVVLDGDYEILENRRSRHRRVVVINRHSVENYLFEKMAAEQVCRDYCKLGGNEEVIGDTFELVLEIIESELMELVILDVAHCRAGSNRQVLPARAEYLLEHNRPDICFSKPRIRELCEACRCNFDQTQIEKARILINNFMEKRRFVDVLRGHFAFNLLRRIIFNAIRHKTGRYPSIDNNGLMIMLSVQVWARESSRDHRNLKRRLSKAAREAAQKRSATAK